MKNYKKIIILVVVLFIILLLIKYRNKIPILREHFDNTPSHSFQHNHTELDDIKDMKVIVITFYYSDTCPKSREFLYGCCRDLKGDKEIIGTKMYQMKNQDGKHDSYEERLRYWFQSDSLNNKNNIIKSDFYKDIPQNEDTCMPLNYFRKENENENARVIDYDNKCFIKKKPTYFYLEDFINKFNENYITDLDIQGIGGIGGIKYEDINGEIDLNPIDLDNLKYEIRLKVEEFKEENQIASLFIDIPRFPAIREGQSVVRSRNRYLGNLNNMNEIGEFINTYLNISKETVNNKYVIKYFHNDSNENYKKKITFETINLDTNFYKQNKYNEYISYLYSKYIQNNDFKKLEGEFSKFKPMIVSGDYLGEERGIDIDKRILNNNYLQTRPKILWKNIVSFPETRNDYIAIVFRDDRLTEYYNGLGIGDNLGDTPKKLIYWIIWNVPKKDMEMMELTYDTLINSENNKKDGVREYSEIYPYQIFDKANIQYYFDDNNITERESKISLYGASHSAGESQSAGESHSAGPSHSADINEIFNYEERSVKYKIDIYNYNKETAIELDKDYENLVENNLELFYDKLIIKLGENKFENLEEKDKEELFIKYKLEDNEEKNEKLSKFFMNNDLKDNKKLVAFSYKMKYYKLADNLSINLEKKTYWILYFNVTNPITLYINNEMLVISDKFEYRIPYKTNSIYIYIKLVNSINEESDFLVIKESKIPTYRLNWEDIFYDYRNKLQKNNNGIKLKEGVSTTILKGKFKLDKENSVNNNIINIDYRVNFDFDNIKNKEILVNDEIIEETNLCPDPSPGPSPGPCPSILNTFNNKLLISNENEISFSITLNSNSVLYNGTVSPIEINNIIEEVNIDNIKANRVSTIQLDTLGCNLDAEYTIQSVPTLRYIGHLEGNTELNESYGRKSRDNLRLAIRIYEEDKLKPSYLEWGIDIDNLEKMDNIIQYELFKNSRTNKVKNIELNNLEMKFKTQNSNKYYSEKINNNCKKITKYTLTETSEIVFKNLPPKLIRQNIKLIRQNVKFISDNFDENRFYNEVNNLEIIYNKIKEKFQLWKKEGGFIYSWVGEQKYPESLFVENSEWVFSPKYQDTLEFKSIDVGVFPTWYNRNKNIDMESVYHHNINVELVNNNVNDNKEIYNCNLTESNSISPIPSDLDTEVMFTNTLFSLGDLSDKITLDFPNATADFVKKFKVEIIPYFHEKEFGDSLSGIVKEKYINPNLVENISSLLNKYGIEKILNNITDNLLMYRGNLDILNNYVDRKEILRLKHIYYNLDETSNFPYHIQEELKKIDPTFDIIQELRSLNPQFPEIDITKRVPVIMTYNSTLDNKLNLERYDDTKKEYLQEKNDKNIAKIFNDFMEKNMYYYENYQSYGDLGIYQNETCLIYKSPIVDKISNLCPFFRDYVSKTKDNMSTSLLHKINIIVILNYCKILNLVNESYIFDNDIDIFNILNDELLKYGIGDIKSTIKNSGILGFGASTDIFDHNKYTYVEKECAPAPCPPGNISELIKEIQKLKEEEMDLIHKVEKDNLKSTDTYEPCLGPEPSPGPSPEPSSTCLIDKETYDCPTESNGPSPSRCLSEDKTNKIKYLRDIYVIVYYINKIKELILGNIEDMIKYDKNGNRVNELLAIMEKFYIFALKKHNIYFKNEESIFSKMDFNDLELIKIPKEFEPEPETYSDTIDNAVKNYRTMMYNIFN